MRQAGKTLKDYPDIELPNATKLEQLGNRMINEELSYDMEALKSEHQTIIINLNHDQKMAFDAIIESAERGQGK